MGAQSYIYETTSNIEGAVKYICVCLLYLSFLSLIFIFASIIYLPLIFIYIFGGLLYKLFAPIYGFALIMVLLLYIWFCSYIYGFAGLLLYIWFCSYN